ncbi:acyl-homoserine-lactone synthase [Pseudoalteromonas sp. R3]|uniref:acyl-homoserine-lactone synthase n=1 Tax=Pseudoalteromonas sp. R3 TaxID=1709477 RepID=UPI0006B56B3E|nr:acyl-homoserine-lactone synthase [Pseudoalteromonas sp. R3]AZZ99630.1 GNAT family N-acetyltransferase [Pseudoalteromonas sp. R3]
MTKAISIIENNWQVLVTRASNKLIDCFKLRHSVFSEELRWVKTEQSKMEIDKYDFASTHVMAYQEDTVKGYMRITPEHSPWLLNDTFSFLIEDKNYQFEKNSAEVTRLAVDIISRDAKVKDTFTVCDLLIKGLLAHAQQNNIQYWYIVVSRQILSLLKRKGLPCEILGKTVTMPDGVRTVAAKIDVRQFISACNQFYLTNTAPEPAENISYLQAA